MITINLDKAKTISHTKRREKRAEEFEPLDNIIMKQIPGTDIVAVEAQRQEIRDKYAQIQINIDTATDPEQLKNIINTM